MQTFGAHRGLGVDLSPKKVDSAIASGHSAVVADATDLDLAEDTVDFVLMIHFVEHLPTFDAAVRTIASAIRVARSFVYIRHPWFDADAQLFDLGYKFYWSDWVGHKLHFDRLAFVRAFNRLGFKGRWCLMGRGLVQDTRHSSIIPLFAPFDSFAADAQQAAQRTGVELRPTAFSEVACLIQTGDHDQFEAARRQLDASHVLLMDVNAQRSSGT